MYLRINQLKVNVYPKGYQSWTAGLAVILNTNLLPTHPPTSHFTVYIGAYIHLPAVSRHAVLLFSCVAMLS